MTSTPPGPDDTPPGDELVQMNVRVPLHLREAIDARRGPLGLSRDKWVTRALTWALAQPVTNLRRQVLARTPSGRTARGKARP